MFASRSIDPVDSLEDAQQENGDSLRTKVDVG